MRNIDLMAQELLLTVLPNSSVGEEINKELQERHHKIDDEWPEEYYAELSELYRLVFERAAQLSIPHRS